MTNNILTTNLAEQLAPGLLRNSIDERIVRIRPMSTPIDQISRCAGARSVRSMIVDYYSVDTKPVMATLTATPTIDLDSNYSEDNPPVVTIKTDNDRIFSLSDTLIINDAHINNDKGSSAPLVLYVAEAAKNQGDGVKCLIVSAFGDYKGGIVDKAEKGAQVVRMGRAAAELDVQTPQFVSLPVKARNFCQIFKMQVEQSTMQRIVEKEVGWNFSDQEEAAVIDMRMGMEKNFLFGHKARFTDPAKNQEVFLTGGIWHQTDREVPVSLTQLTAADMLAICKEAFTRNNGSRRKILLAGTDLINALSQLEYTKTLAGGDTVVKWGIELKEIRSNFGSLYVVHSEIFDECGHAGDGFILDPDYLTKYCHTPFSVETLDLRTSGQRNTDAVVITEASCLVLRYPDSHLRVIGI